MTQRPLDSIIWEIVQAEHITDQQSLLKLLEARGFCLNQSTLSRHLRKMGIVKRQGYYQADSDRDELNQDSVRHLVKEVKKAPPNLVFIQALPGHAAALGYHLDKLGLVHIVGTVAGDDTLLVAVNPPEQLEQVVQDLKKGLGLTLD